MLAWVALASKVQTQPVGTHLKNVSQMLLSMDKFVGLYSSEYGLLLIYVRKYPLTDHTLAFEPTSFL